MVGGAAPGWYPDPGSKDSVRYWDGVQWTEHTTPASPVEIVHPPGWPRFEPPAADPPPAPARITRRPPVASIVALVVVVLVAGLGVIGSFHPTKRVASPLASAPDATPPYHPSFGPDGNPAFVPYSADAAPVDPPAGALPAVLYSVPAGLAVVTPVSAHNVVLALWSIRSRAIAAQDRDTLSTIETGSALEIDAARGCGCGRSDHFGPAINPTVAVTFSPDFPASFYAEVQTTLNNTPWVQSLVVTRAARDKPWRLAFAGAGRTLANAAAISSFAITPDGFAIFPDLPNTEGAKPLAPALAAYWEDAKHGRKPPPKPNWGPGPLTNEWFTHIAINPAGKPQSENGLVGYYRYAVAAGTTPYIVALANGSSLACSTIVGETTLVAPPGKLIKQDTGRETWGRDVPPGAYRAVVVVDNYTPCINYSTAGGYVNVYGVGPNEATTIGIP